MKGPNYREKFAKNGQLPILITDKRNGEVPKVNPQKKEGGSPNFQEETITQILGINFTFFIFTYCNNRLFNTVVLLQYYQGNALGKGETGLREAYVLYGENRSSLIAERRRFLLFKWTPAECR